MTMLEKTFQIKYVCWSTTADDEGGCRKKARELRCH